jgi:hypothetical protein
VFVPGRRLAVALGVVGMLAGAVGCGGGSTPRTLPPLSTTPAANATTPPATTEKADLHAATAVVREYYSAINRLSRRMDARALSALSLPSCSCRAFVRDVRRTAAKNQRYFGHIKVVGLAATADSARQVQVFVTYDSSRGGTKADDGQILFIGRAHKGTKQNFVLQSVGTHWLIASIQLIKPGTPT